MTEPSQDAATQPSPAPQQPIPEHLDSAFQKLVAGWMGGAEGAPEDAEHILEDLKEASAGLTEHQKALGKLQQEAQQRQAEVAKLDGQMQAYLRVLHRQYMAESP